MNRYAVELRIRTASRVTVYRRIIVETTDEAEAQAEATEYITNEYPTARKVAAVKVEEL